ncbi:MAG: hypothetical protein NT049_16465, partial [Planctomycetota bacterium]|nr:hypothetical protein [Planctomycetota bacterium]
MLRYLGYLLMVVAVLAMAGTAAVCLFGGLAEKFRTSETVRLIALDEAATTQTQVLHVGAQLQDLDYGRPIADCYIVARFDDGWLEPNKNYTDSLGLIRWNRRGPLPAGRHSYTVLFPETHPRVDIRARGTVWVVAAGVRALWVDVAALAPNAQLAATPSGPLKAEAMQSALGPLKTLAKGRQVVYLVADGIVEYQAIRTHLAEVGAPPGPVIWLRKGNELER